MNIWSRLLLHLRRSRLRQRFMKQQAQLQTALLLQMTESGKGTTNWQNIEWLTEPILHVLPDTDQVPVALVGIVALLNLDEVNAAETVPQAQAGTAVFYFEDDAWQSKGKILLNLTPAEAFEHLKHKAMVL